MWYKCDVYYEVVTWWLNLPLCLTEQIKPQHIVGEDSLDNDDEPRKSELYMHDPYAELTNKRLIVQHN